MSKSYAELKQLSLEDLVKEHDQLAHYTQIGVSYYLDEIHRRQQDRQTTTMLRYTWWITIMTLVMTACTLANLWFVWKSRTP